MSIKGILLVMESYLHSINVNVLVVALCYGFANVVIEESWIKGTGISIACESTMISK